MDTRLPSAWFMTSNEFWILLISITTCIVSIRERTYRSYFSFIVLSLNYLTFKALCSKPSSLKVFLHSERRIFLTRDDDPSLKTIISLGIFWKTYIFVVFSFHFSLLCHTWFLSIDFRSVDRFVIDHCYWCTKRLCIKNRTAQEIRLSGVHNLFSRRFPADLVRCFRYRRHYSKVPYLPRHFPLWRRGIPVCLRAAFLEELF